MDNQHVDAQAMIDNLTAIYSKQVTNLTTDLAKIYSLLSELKNENNELRNQIAELSSNQEENE